MAEELLAEGKIVERESCAQGNEDKKLECCKELLEEQLRRFYEKPANNEEAVQCMALEILKLPNFTYKGNIACIIDYCVGVLMYAQEKHLSASHILLMYQLAMETLEKIKEGASLKKTEKIFKDMVFRWSVKVKNTNYVAVLTTIELQKIVPFFMDTVFQHYRLYNHCFNQESLHWRYYEKVYIETPMVYPLKKFDTMEEINQDKTTQDAYEKSWAKWKVERLANETKAQWLLDNPPKPKRPPNNLDEYIDFSIRDKVEEMMKLMQEQYEQRMNVLYSRVQSLEENNSI